MALLKKYTLDKAAAELSLSVPDLIGLAAIGEAEICANIEFNTRALNAVASARGVSLCAGEWLGSTAQKIAPGKKTIPFSIQTDFGVILIGHSIHDFYWISQCKTLMALPPQIFQQVETAFRHGDISDDIPVDGDSIFCKLPTNYQTRVLFLNDDQGEHEAVEANNLLHPVSQGNAEKYAAIPYETHFQVVVRDRQLALMDLLITAKELERLKSLVRQGADEPGKDDLSSLTGAKKTEALPESDRLFPASKWKCTAQAFTEGALEDNKGLHDNLLGDDANKFQEAKSDLIGKIYTHLFSSAALGNDDAKTNRGHSPSKNSVDKDFLTPYIIHLKKQKKTK